QWMSIHVLIAQGLSQREIARRLGISRNTVARYAASDDVPRYKQRAPRPTKLSPFHDYILERMAAAHPDVMAAPALLRESQELGYTGQLRSLQVFMRAHQPAPKDDHEIGRASCRANVDISIVPARIHIAKTKPLIKNKH